MTGIFALSGCAPQPSQLQQILQQGELKVLTLNGPTTFYEGPEGPAGIEYELIQRFTDFIGVKPRFIIPDSFNEIIPALTDGKAHIAAVGLTVTDKRKKRIRFSTPYQTITSQVVYLSGTRKPRKPKNLLNKKIAVIAGSSHEELLVRLQKKFPKLKWVSKQNTVMEILMQQVLDRKIDFVIGDSNEIAINRRYFPKINIAFDISPPEQLAWALPHSQDDSLYKKTLEFFDQLKKSGELEQLLEHYYGHVDRMNFVDKRTFWRHVENRLPDYQHLFNKAAELTGYDWRLLAAVSYQESHWNPAAKSPTGVRGLMMLTKATAKQLKIKNRLDPEQSVMGGARYLKIIEKKIPKRIPMPDRLWMTLAGYNVGFGHLEDARVLTQRKGGNPDKWSDIRKYLPELSKPKVYKTLRYGYARGNEPVNYVDNIKNYFDLLVWKEKLGKSRKKRNQFNPMPKTL
ncbi:MAG: membrane-bound lytic murein transglycosylase MltF [Gammaproteobacteria bacterium]|nr:membrane-bound lytic murein transglycosylase MltF [Gammaproteobacteria bacterium]